MRELFYTTYLQFESVGRQPECENTSNDLIGWEMKIFKSSDASNRSHHPASYLEFISISVNNRR